MTPGERAFWADEVVKVTADAFDDVEHKFMRAVLSATNADQAWNGLLAYRALMEVRKQLNTYVDTGKLEREAANRRAAD
jgi:cytochrome oxidase Cu insertion factor (SCO1/SenC/PrrC family)